ncbi:MAG: D-alanyl-D-alanine carboxypeptidase [Clostridia bacterium]|nr:D-alanyl-D-alanine carboxypeptidase [Clostridia bacterium]
MDRFTRRSDKCFYSRKIMGLILLVILLIACPVGGLTMRAKAEARSATIVIEAESGRVLAAQNAQVRLPLASTTKILTAITVIEHTDVNRVVAIPKQAEGVEGSSIYLRAGQKWSVTDLLYGLMLRSGNDSAVALALITAGSVDDFATMMNSTAVAAGAYNSNFTNPHGLDDNKHYTTAFDLAMISRYAMRSSLFREIVASKKHDYTDDTGKKCAFINKNKMLTGFNGANGIKTGFTKTSGRCLVSSALREDMQLICVVLNTSNMWQASAQLMEKSYKNYDMVTLADKEKPLTYAKLKYDKGEVAVSVQRTLRYPLSEEEKSNIRYEYNTVSNRTNTDKNIYMGKVNIYHKNYLLFSEKLYTI